jgi:hypothetical protein
MKVVGDALEGVRTAGKFVAGGAIAGLAVVDAPTVGPIDAVGPDSDGEKTGGAIGPSDVG